MLFFLVRQRQAGGQAGGASSRQPHTLRVMAATHSLSPPSCQVMCIPKYYVKPLPSPRQLSPAYELDSPDWGEIYDGARGRRGGSKHGKETLWHPVPGG